MYCPETWAKTGLQVTVSDRVARVRLDRPASLNAIDPPLMRSIIEAFDEFDRNDQVWVVLLTGSGTRAFCAGIDLKAAARAENREWLESMPTGGTHRNMFEVVLECRKPVVTALNGVSVGAGCELALASDIRLAAPGVNIGLPEAKRGMGANFGAQMLPRLIPRGMAYEMLYTGEPVTAEVAAKIGLINRIISSEQLLAEAEALCRTIAGNAPLTVRRYKEAITKGAEMPISAASRLSTHYSPYRSEDQQEGVVAFTEKRAPNWKVK